MAEKRNGIQLSQCANTTDSRNPFLMTSLAAPLHKGFDLLVNFLTMPLTKKRRANLMPETVDKTALTLLAQMTTKERPEIASNWLSIIGTAIYMFAQQLYNAKNKVISLLDSFLKETKADQGANLFSVSASTVNRAFDQIPRHDVDLLLSEQRFQIEQKLGKEGLHANEGILVVDPSDVIYTGKYKNQYTTWGKVGQKDTYARGYKENMLYVNPGAFIASSNLQTVQPEERYDRDLPLWIGLCRNGMREERALGTTIRLLEGDREFFKALGFAFSRLGLWDASLSLTENPRFLCPKKLWEKGDVKWDYLLNPNAPIIKEDKISLDFYQTPFLGKDLSRLPCNKARTKYEVPVVAVAVFDSYPNGHKQETMSWAHARAQEIAKKLHDLPLELKDLEKDYRDYVRQQQKYKYSSKTKKSASRKISSPKYEGKQRSSFKDPEEKRLYRLCCRKYDLIQDWEQRKSHLSKRLMFFNLSLYEGESITGKETEYTAFIRQYHERWGIENGFKAIKYSFPLKTNCRGACARHARWILSCMMYNAWHFWRLLRASRIYKEAEPGWKPFEKDYFIPIRKKIERTLHPILSAQGYLMEELRRGINNRIKKVISTLF